MALALEQIRRMRGGAVALDALRRVPQQGHEQGQGQAQRQAQYQAPFLLRVLVAYRAIGNATNTTITSSRSRTTPRERGSWRTIAGNKAGGENWIPGAALWSSYARNWSLTRPIW